jgi:hypothetical protein
MANLWLRTLGSMTMNSEEHSEVFVDANDQRDWPVDDSVEAFMQARFRVLSMPHDEVQRYLSILRRRYSPHADDSSATLGALSALSGESTRLGATPHTSSFVGVSFDGYPSLTPSVFVILGQISDSVAYSFGIAFFSHPCQT